MAVSFDTVREFVNVECYKHRLQELSLMCVCVWGGVGMGVDDFFEILVPQGSSYLLNITCGNF